MIYIALPLSRHKFSAEPMERDLELMPPLRQALLRPSFVTFPLVLKSHSTGFKQTQVSACLRRPATCLHSSPGVGRRPFLRLAALIPLSIMLPPGQANSDDDAITFTKIPCNKEGCRAVEYHDYKMGKGNPAQKGRRITIKWTGRLTDRYGWPIQKEDAEEVSFVLGKDKLIKGFELAIDGMQEGGKRRMIIPAELGYTDDQSGPLPARYGDRRRLFATVLNSRRFKRAGDLVIDVQLLKVRPVK